MHPLRRIAALTDRFSGSSLRDVIKTAHTHRMRLINTEASGVRADESTFLREVDLLIALCQVLVPHLTSAMVSAMHDGITLGVWKVNLGCAAASIPKLDYPRGAKN